MAETAAKIVKVSLMVIGALSLVTAVGLFMVGMEELHPEAWTYDD